MSWCSSSRRWGQRARSGTQNAPPSVYATYRPIGAQKSLFLRAPQSQLLAHNAFIALLKHIVSALEEEHAKDVLLELDGVHLASQNVGGSQEMTLKLGESELVLGRYGIMCRRKAAVRQFDGSTQRLFLRR